MRRRRLLAAAAGLAGAAVAAATLGALRDDGAPAAASTAPARTAPVTRQTLQDGKTASGTLGYGTATTATSRLPGTLTRVPGTGDTITRGHALYEVDGHPVTLLYGGTPAYRTLREGMSGADVKALERNLKALGYDGFTADRDFTSGTAAAVREWQDDLGEDETGEVALGSVVFAPAAVRVDALLAGEGDPTGPGRKVLTFTGTERAVTASLDVDDLRLARDGAAVTIELPDGAEVPGRISSVSTVAKAAAAQGGDPTTEVRVEIALGARAQRAAAAYTLASVDVDFTAGVRRGVLTVPVAALVALPAGGFGVQVVKAGGAAYVPVRTGLFAGGRVEVSGAGLAPGTAVGVPE
ncbi:peptidoglycan-binding protein [Actinomadura parmotrematis]|uniref:peptidoglycan-binding protein n=1 Tax=Actinomadura parmotrematis TaxID=2864039 RepID=UPI0027E33CBE|nr:peptidoglycan-binding protein [Actinomadura parmotrematis]